MSATEAIDYYQLLGVERNATKEQIREAYREIARIYHPDSHFYDDLLPAEMVSANSEAELKFKEITLAYNTLSSDEKRSEYDNTLLGNLPAWDEDLSRNWHTEHQYATAANGNNNQERQHPHSWGAFGRIPESERSAFDNHEDTVHSVSEIIRGRRTILGRLKRIFGLR